MDDRLEAELQVDLLCDKADDALGLCQYATMESLLAEAERIADQHGDLATRIRVRFDLALARQLQCKYEDALTTFGWLLGLAVDPDAADLLSAVSA